MIKVKDLSINYPDSTRAVNRVSFSIKPGEFILVAGDSASGKSTLFKTICGFIPYIIEADKKGSIWVKGKKDLSPIEAARTIGMVHQDPESQFCCHTVEEEIAFGPENLKFKGDMIEWAVSRSLGLVGAEDLRQRDLYTLSGGEKQKVAIASVLALKPEVLILDEPTSSLDHDSITQVLGAIKRIKQKYPQLTMIVLEHRIKEFKDIADRLMVMKEGKLVRDLKRKEENFQKTVNEIISPLDLPTLGKEPLEEILSVKNLTFYAGNKRILKNISFNIRKGSVTALMGPNGAGKTSVLRCILGLETNKKGTITLSEKPLGKEKPWDLGKRIGMVFQNPNHQIFTNTVEQEFMFGPQNYRKGRKEAQIALQDFANQENITDQRHPHAMSFGQKRRLNIQTSASHLPDLILLDEPFAGQDKKNTKKIIKGIQKLQAKGITFIVVTHDPFFAKSFCTDAIFLRKGKVAAFGDPSEVISITKYGGGAP